MFSEFLLWNYCSIKLRERKKFPRLLSVNGEILSMNVSNMEVEQDLKVLINCYTYNLSAKNARAYTRSSG